LPASPQIILQLYGVPSLSQSIVQMRGIGLAPVTGLTVFEHLCILW
jgi:hypothetical protein